MCVQRFDLLLLAELRDHLRRRLERVLAPGEKLDEAGVALEELGKLFWAQLPR
jgi:hypothetical protein